MHSLGWKKKIAVEPGFLHDFFCNQRVLTVLLAATWFPVHTGFTQVLVFTYLHLGLKYYSIEGRLDSSPAHS